MRAFSTRGFRWTAAGLAGALVLSCAAAFAARGRYQVQQVKPGIFVWVPEDLLDFDSDPKFSLAGTAGFIVTHDGVVVVNTTNSPFHARELLYEIRERTDQPVKYVINTDARGDHMLGNEVFMELGAKILASTAASTAMRHYEQDIAQRLEADGEAGVRMQERMRGIHFTLPRETFDDHITLTVGGEEMRLTNLGAGPTPGDIVVYLPQSKVVFLGELYESGYLPRLDGVNLKKWVAALRQVETWGADTYVPGHGAPGTQHDLDEFIKFLEWTDSQLTHPTAGAQPKSP